MRTTTVAALVVAVIVPTGGNGWLAARPGAIERLLRSLVRTEDFAVQHPDEAKAIVGRRLNYTETYKDEIWQQNRFGLSLDRFLVIAMNDGGAGAIASYLTNATGIPDLGEHINTTGLGRVGPDAGAIL